MKAFWTRVFRRGEAAWKEIEEEAERVEQLPSWHARDDNVLMLEAFEWYVPHDGQHWHRLRQALPDLREIGIDNLLLPPGCKAMHASGNGYDIYDLYDLGEFDQKGTVATKWGTRADLQRLAETAHQMNMGVYWDAVLNHKAGADYTERFRAVTVEPQDRNIELTTPKDIQAWVGFNFPGRGDTYSTMKYHWHHFTGTDYNALDRKNAIYKIVGPGKDWAKDVSRENGNYDYLMFADLDYSHPEVREDVLKWCEWIGTELPLRGMRLDATKHYSSEFQKTLIDHVRRTVGRDWFMVSEFWSANIQELQKYLAQIEYKAHLFDAALVNRLSAISRTKGGDLRLIFDRTLVKHRPENAVTFVMNHDTQPSQALEAPIADFFKPLAYALILLRKQGFPSVFYGDLYGIEGGVKRPLPPSCDGRLPTLTLARKLYAYGEQRDYFTRRNCIGFVRYGNARHPWGLACVLSNGPPAKMRMLVGKRHAGEVWSDILKWCHDTVTIDPRGYGEFPVSDMSVSVWVNTEAEGRNRFRPFNSNIYSY